MEFLSEELNKAPLSPSSITHIQTPVVDTENVKNEIKTILFLRDRNLLNVYENSLMNRSDSISGNQTLRDLMSVIRNYIASKYRDDDVKNLTIRKNFDIISLSLESLVLNKNDISSEEMKTIILGFLVKNFL